MATFQDDICLRKDFDYYNDLFRVKISSNLSEIAYAPHESCILLSLQMSATKADFHGTWDTNGISNLTKDDGLVGQALL